MLYYNPFIYIGIWLIALVAIMNCPVLIMVLIWAAEALIIAVAITMPLSLLLDWWQGRIKDNGNCD